MYGFEIYLNLFFDIWQLNNTNSSCNIKISSMEVKGSLELIGVMVGHNITRASLCVLIDSPRLFFERQLKLGPIESDSLLVTPHCFFYMYAVLIII